MLDWLGKMVASTTTTVTFFTIFLAGAAFSVFSLIMGGHHDSADHDVGTDSDMSDHGGDSDGDGDGPFSVGVISVRGAALLATGFGGIGFVLFVNTQRVLFSTAAAMVGGYLFAFLVLYALRIFKAQQANSLVQASTAVGAEGVVTVSIPEGGLGEVSLLMSGNEMFKSARSMDGAVIKSGTRVQVRQIAGGALIVTPVEVK
jgi:membrane protein implicated in regulation of membrane protease activity